jgi:hypothetical protein
MATKKKPVAKAAKAKSPVKTSAKIKEAEKAITKAASKLTLPKDGSIPAFLDRKKHPELAAKNAKPAKGKPPVPPKAAPVPQKPLSSKDLLLARLKGSTTQPTHGKGSQAQGKGKVVPFRVPPGTQLTLQTIRVGMPVLIRDKNGRPGTKVYTILAWPPNEPAYTPDFFVYSEDYAAHISDIVAA